MGDSQGHSGWSPLLACSGEAAVSEMGQNAPTCLTHGGSELPRGRDPQRRQLSTGPQRMKGNGWSGVRTAQAKAWHAEGMVSGQAEPTAAICPHLGHSRRELAGGTSSGNTLTLTQDICLYKCTPWVRDIPVPLSASGSSFA